MRFTGKAVVLLLITASLATFAAHGQAKVVDRIVAIVNDDIITMGDLNKLIIERARQLEAMYDLSAQEARARAEEEKEQILDQLIEHLVLVSEARRRQVEVTEPEIQDYLSVLKDQAGIKSDEEFKAELAKQGYTLSKYRDEVRKRIMADKVLAQELAGKSEVSDEEIAEFHEKNKDQFRSTPSEKVHLKHIFIRKGFSESERQRVINRINEAYQKLLNGEDFAQVAEEYSDNPQISLGKFRLDELKMLNAQLANEASKLDVGAFSKPMETGTGYNIIRVDSRTDDSIELSSIYVTYRSSPEEEKAVQDKVNTILDRLNAGESFEKLAAEFSDDEETKNNGGFLGVKSLDELGPDIRKAVENLKPGQVSEPIINPFGVHILKVDARSRDELSDYEREQIRAFLREDKFNKQRILFVEKLKKNMFVKIML